MITPENKQLLEDLTHSQFGVALKAFLDDEFAELKDITNAKSWEDTLGRQQAVKVLEKLFRFMGEKVSEGKGKNNYE